MKSSTMSRSNISRERIAALEELLSNNSRQYDSSPGVYIRSDKDRELDILWQGFKINHKEERSPLVYLSIGFFTGAICMFLMTAILNFGNPAKENLVDLNLWKKAHTGAKVQPTPVTLTPSSEETAQASTRNEIYEVQEGDTLEGIALRFYGTSTPEKIEQIQQANGMDDPNSLQIGQKINVPID